MAKNLSSHIQDTTDFPCKLRNLPDLPEGTLLVTLDVVSLYSNIPHDDGTTACHRFLNARSESERNPSTEDLCKLIDLILTNNILSFDEKLYLQVLGTAMGTKMASSYSGVFRWGRGGERKVRFASNKRHNDCMLARKRVWCLPSNSW